MVLDLCEERYGESEIDEKHMESVLVELGKPSKIAGKYKETRPLIGSELMPIFKLVLFTVCIITAVVSIISFAFNISDYSAAQAFLYFAELLGSLMSVVGYIFVIFFILERVIKNKKEIDFDNDKWSIKDLPELNDKLPSRAEVIAGFIFSVIAIIALNLFIDFIGIYSVDSGGTVFTPILSPDFKNLLPLFSIRIALGAVVGLPFISKTGMESARNRNYYYQSTQMGLAIFDIGIIFLLLKRGIGSFFIVSNFSVAGLENLVPMATKVFTGVLILLLVLSVYNLIKRALVILPKGQV
jgi:hypothetical protein